MTTKWENRIIIKMSLKDRFDTAPRHSFKRAAETQIFMQDNAPCHKAKTVSSFPEEEGIDVIKWPLQSSDMNPQENV